ncbi:MAG: hypothetical protein ACP5JH_09730 [Bacteroidota bacterium]
MNSLDTSREMEKLQIEILRKMNPERRLNLAMQLLETGRKLLMEGIRSRHPEYKEEEIRLALIRTLLGDKQFEIIYPHAKGTKP